MQKQWDKKVCGWGVICLGSSFQERLEYSKISTFGLKTGLLDPDNVLTMLLRLTLGSTITCLHNYVYCGHLLGLPACLHARCTTSASLQFSCLLGQGIFWPEISEMYQNEG